jgi:Aldehyde dehydrogenase family
VAAARQAFPAWSARSAADRGRLLLALADAIEEHAAELARLKSLDTGHPIRDTSKLDVPRTAAAYRYFGGIADKYLGSVVPVETGFLNYVLREPIGVAGSIVPWNFPLMFTSWKLGPALAAGNTAVLKASELTPLAALISAAVALPTAFLAFRLRGGYLAIGTWVIAEVFLLVISQVNSLGAGSGASLNGLSAYSPAQRQADTYWVTLALLIAALGGHTCCCAAGSGSG